MLIYKYQCSKNDCGHTWVVTSGNLNGFVLTCPHCGKGRGIFVEQIKKENDNMISTQKANKI